MPSRRFSRLFEPTDEGECARRVITAGLAEAGARGARGWVGPLVRLDADVLLAEGDAERAGVRAREAFAMAEELGAFPEIAHCHETLGRVATHLRDPSASEHAATARRIFEQLGMSYWAGRVTPTS